MSSSIAIVGAGHLGSIHAKLLAQRTDATLAGIVDPNEAQGRAVAELHGVPWYAHLDALPDVDGVIIAAPTTYHHALTLRSLERGFHTFIEKPVTATYDESIELMAAAATVDRVVQVGHVERFNPAVRAIAPYNIEPKFIEGHRLAPFKPRAIDVSVVHDLMIHDIDLLLWLTKSEIVAIQATGVAVLTDTPDICNARLTFANGCVANLTASRISAKPMRKLRIFQKDTYISLDLGAGAMEMFRLVDKQILMETPAVEPVNAIAEEQRSFIESMTSGVPAAVTLREGAEAVRIAEQIEALL
ncbi:MAG: Gfo/Idh/MocA family protein [Candidatus Kapaibacteriota bacterium]|jgi:predicted dehydrogenase